MTFNYSSAFPASFGANAFATDIPGLNLNGLEAKSLSNIDFNALNNLNFDPSAFDNSFDFSQSAQDQTWTFITAPMEISWSTSNKADRVDIFGTNNPPVVTGTKGMRDLKLNNSLVEGFTRRVSVEAKVIALENLMNYQLNPSGGFVNVPVYQVYANDKIYGENGYYIIKGVSVKEQLRDLKGLMTRAVVDIDFMQVPEYQVDSGIDQASTPISGAKTTIPPAKEQAKQVGVPTGKAKAGPAAPPAGYKLTRTSVSKDGTVTKFYQNSSGQKYSIRGN
jgi:hypothetical protein